MIVQIQKKCKACGKPHTIEVDDKKFQLWMSGKVHIQNALPNISDNDRELLLSGICGKCFDEIFKEET